MHLREEVEPINTESATNKTKMPISLRFAVGLLLVRIFFILLIVTLQTWFLSSPPTSGAALGVWEGLQHSLGDKATNPGYVMGYSFASTLLVLPIFPAAYKRSKGWLKAARICIIVEMLANLGNANIPGVIGDIILTFLLFSKGAKKYVAQEVQETLPT